MSRDKDTYVRPQADSTVFSKIYGLNMKLQDSVHVVRQAMDNARWHEVLLGLRDVQAATCEISLLLREIEPQGFAQVCEVVGKFAASVLAPAFEQAAAEREAKKDEGRVATAPTTAKR